jgi:TonB family protein
MLRLLLLFFLSSSLVLACRARAEAASDRVYSAAEVTTPVHLTAQPKPEYPDSLRQAGISGYVMVSFIAGADGVVRYAKAIDSSNAAFVDSAVASVQRWKFKPAQLDGHPVDCVLSAVVNFTPPSSHQPAPADSRTVGNLQVYRGDQVTRHAVPLVRTPPKYPARLRDAGVQGEATIDFIVMSDGSVAQPTVFAATDPRFGDAAVACVKTWKFKPAQVDGKPVAVRMHVPIVFSLHR